MKKLEISRKDLKGNISLIVKKASSYGKDDEGCSGCNGRR